MVNISSLACIQVLNNSVSVCLFPECFSEVKYVTVLPEQIGQLLLYMCVCGELTLIEQTKPLSPLVRKDYEIYFGYRILFGLQKFAAAHV